VVLAEQLVQEQEEPVQELPLQQEQAEPQLVPEQAELEEH